MSRPKSAKAPSRVEVQQADLTKFSDAMWKQFPSWMQIDACRAQYNAWVRTNLRRVNDGDWAQKGSEAIGWPGATVEDYRESLLQVEGTRHVVGIRFFGGKGGKPFVDVNLSDAPPNTTDWNALLVTVQQRYARFKPSCLRRVRWLRHDEEMKPALGWSLDQVLLAAPLGELTGAQRQRDAGVRFSPIEPYDVAVAAHAIQRFYEAWYQEHPWMSGFVNPQSEASLARAIEHDAALAMTTGDTLIGVASAIPEPEFRTGCPGLAVYEKVVDPNYAGRGLSHALHAALVQMLARKYAPQTLLYGTIDHRNSPSINNALRAGRKPAAALELLSA